MFYSAVVHACIRKAEQINYITNNIANVNTPGFKADKLLFVRKQSTPPMENNAFSHNQILTVDYTPGGMQKSGNPLDLSIQGGGFFVVETQSGEAYTRNGSFAINKDGELVTKSGDCVLGESGKIVINGEDVQIGSGGAVEVDGERAGKLRIVNFKNRTSIVKIGRGLFEDHGNAGLMEEKDPKICSGYLELSNVKVIKEMVEMINAQRSFEAYQKVMRTVSEQDEMATNRIGKLRG